MKTVYRLHIGPFQYIGETNDPLEERMRQHKSKAFSGVHTNWKIQAAHDLFPDDFYIEEVEGCTEEEATRELWGDHMCLNLSPTGKGWRFAVMPPRIEGKRAPVDMTIKDNGKMCGVRVTKPDGSVEEYTSIKGCAFALGYRQGAAIHHKLSGRNPNPPRRGRHKGWLFEYI